MPTKETKDYQNILAIVVGLLVLSLVFNVKELAWVAVLLGLATLFSNRATAIIAELWLKLSEAIGFVISRIILTLTFFVVLTPLALIYRLFKKDSLQLRRSLKNTYYFDRNCQYSAKDLINPW